MLLTELITQNGLQALAEFTLCAAPKYDGLKRIEGNDGLELSCTRDHDGKGHWIKQWPGHVEAPTLRGIAMVAQEHWREAHQDAAHRELVNAEVAK